jgi:hypothetical protein
MVVCIEYRRTLLYIISGLNLQMKRWDLTIKLRAVSYKIFINILLFYKLKHHSPFFLSHLHPLDMKSKSESQGLATREIKRQLICIFILFSNSHFALTASTATSTGTSSSSQSGTNYKGFRGRSCSLVVRRKRYNGCRLTQCMCQAKSPQKYTVNKTICFALIGLQIFKHRYKTNST